jgi:hypothetical protein
MLFIIVGALYEVFRERHLRDGDIRAEVSTEAAVRQ